jgi:hypothetical protein
LAIPFYLINIYNFEFIIMNKKVLLKTLEEILQNQVTQQGLQKLKDKIVPLVPTVGNLAIIACGKFCVKNIGPGTGIPRLLGCSITCSFGSGVILQTTGKVFSLVYAKMSPSLVELVKKLF